MFFYVCYNLQIAAYFVAIAGAIFSAATLAIVPTLAYTSVILAVKKRNPSFYTIYFVTTVPPLTCDFVTLSSSRL